MLYKRDVPTEKEIALLPRGAQIAFAARCVRRIQPLLLLTHVNSKYIKTVEKAILVAESPPPDAYDEPRSLSYPQLKKYQL